MLVLCMYDVVMFVLIRDVPIPHFKPIPILLPIPAFRADTDTADTTDTFLSIEHHQ